MLMLKISNSEVFFVTTILTELLTAKSHMLLQQIICMIPQRRIGVFRNPSNFKAISCARLILPPSIRASFKLLKS